MILTDALLRSNKTWAKGREQAADLLILLAKTFNYPLPTYEFKSKPVPRKWTVEELAQSQTPRSKEKEKPTGTYVCEMQTKIPSRLYNVTKLKPPYVPPSELDATLPAKNKQVKPFIDFAPATITEKGETFLNGIGESHLQNHSKALAALDIVHQVERLFNVPRGSLKNYLEKHQKKIRTMANEYHMMPYHLPIPGIEWENIPHDTSFVGDSDKCATREGNINFFPDVRRNPHAMIAAKSLILASQLRSPTVEVHTQAMKTMSGSVKRYANIHGFGGGPLHGVSGTVPGTELNLNLDYLQAQVVALIHLYNTMTHETTHKKMKKDIKQKYDKMIAAVTKQQDSSYGMAKLYVSLPKHLLEGLESTLSTIPEYQLPQVGSDRTNRPPPRRRDVVRRTSTKQQEKLLHSRVEALRLHQKVYPLPVDSVEREIPYDASITIVRGGTGSGKTTRYPLMLNLFSPQPSRIIVAQPRRLACQTAARRVAQEQNYILGKPNCPIGYSIRFETISPSPECDRTIEFQTPGVLLRYAAEDPLLSDVTHLCIDEIHERNADIDLLLALAKQAVRRRLQHSELPPLRLILMSATLDSSQWESYFRMEHGKKITPELSLVVVNVPEIRRYPIETMHLCDVKFPIDYYKLGKLLQTRAQYNEEFDEEICKITAKLAWHLYTSGSKKLEGSILCFLPGMEEIRRVHRYIEYDAPRQHLPTVVYLHSSVSSADQALAFEPGPKIILSTNIAETSVTIPDCKYVIDSGRERQYSLLSSRKKRPSGAPAGWESDDESSNTVSVVGSQLTTVDISQASAKQRAGRAGRVSAGTCYRLYTQNMYDFEMPEFTEPEMLRMDLSQLVLHAISLYHPSTGGHPLSLLSGAPDPPSEENLRRTLRDLVSQGLVDVGDDDFSWFDITSSDGLEEETKEHRIRLTPLGRVVNEFPVEPGVGRMLLMGLVLQAIDPALTMAALLSVPKAFSTSTDGKEKSSSKKTRSDIIVQMESYDSYIRGQGHHPKALVFDQVRRIRDQLERAMLMFLRRHQHQPHESGESSQVNWNANSDRVVAQAALICCATPHIAHLVNGKEDFATRDVAGTAKIHPSSVNQSTARRAFWYVYHELRVVKNPNIFTTTAVSPLELALFSDSDFLLQNIKSRNGESDFFESIKEAFGDENWLFQADHWVPVVVTKPTQRTTIIRLRRLLMYDMLQQVAQNPISFAKNTSYQQVVLYVLSALEQQRLPPELDNFDDAHLDFLKATV